jgi:plastocyanin
MSIRRRPLAVLVGACVAIALVMPSNALADTFRVRGRLTDVGYRWRPARLSVAVGSRIVWRMVDGTHNVTATSNNWSKRTNNLPEGSRTAFTFNRRGTYRYRCTLHSQFVNGVCNGMCGRVIVG